MTKTELRAAIRSKLGDDEFDATIIDGAVNDYIREICTRVEFRFDQAEDTSLSVATGGTEFTVPTDLRTIKNLYITTANEEGDITNLEMDKNSIRRMRLTTPQPDGKPGAWCLYNGKIQFGVEADRTYTFEMDYIRTPGTLVNESDEPRIPRDYQECIVLGGLERVLRTEDDYGISSNERIILSGLEEGLISNWTLTTGTSKTRHIRRS